MTTDVLTQFPETLSENIDQVKIKRLIQEINYDATNRFFEHFDPQKSDETAFQNATETMNRLLLERTTSDAWIETLCGQDMAGSRRGFLKLHLESLLTPPVIPSPAHLQTIPQTKSLCISAALGALLGILFGELVGGISNGFEPLLRTVIDCTLSIAGAALGVCTAVTIARNKTMQTRLMAVVGGAAVVDTALQLSPAKRFLPFLSFGGYIKRMFLYGVLMLITFGTYRAVKHDVPNYRREIELINEQWLRHAAVTILILAFKVKGLESNPYIPRREDTSVLQKVVRIAQKLQQSPPEDLPIVIMELIQELEAYGFTVQSDAEQLYQEMDWDESLREHYTVIGIPRQGRRVHVLTLPIIRDGKVEKKGELYLLK